MFLYSDARIIQILCTLYEKELVFKIYKSSNNSISIYRRPRKERHFFHLIEIPLYQITNFKILL